MRPLSIAIAGALLLSIQTVHSQNVQDRVPYAPISIPLPDTLDHLMRDSATIRTGRIRLNQAGFRVQDEKVFYYVGEAVASFLVHDVRSGVSVAQGALRSTGKQSSGRLDISAYHKAQLIPGGAVKYRVIGPEVSGTVYEGRIPDLPPGTYTVRVGAQESGPFVLDSSVYGMVKDALLKYYGVARCGDGQSWFHPACHMKDAVTGGWHDAGDHIKVPQSTGYAMAVLSLCAAAFPSRDTDRYGPNHSNTVLTDGLPDVLREAKVGTDFVLNSYRTAGNDVSKMQTEIGGYGPDHQWWGRPEFQDGVPPTRGGPPRPTAHGLGGNTAGTMSAGLAFVGRLYRPYDSSYAVRCIELARALYAYGKKNPAASYSAAMHGGGMTYDELAFAALALWWATGESVYRNDLLYDKTIGTHGNADYYKKGGFSGGWFVKENPGPQKTSANTCWDNVEVYALWGLYRLILMDQATAASFGIDSAERLNLLEDILYCLIVDIADIGAGDHRIDLPRSDFGWKGNTLAGDGLWGWMSIQDNNWMPNRYQAGNITELFCYYDIAARIQGTDLPNSPASTQWKADTVKLVLLRQLDFMLGRNPWDVSMIFGVGHRNLNHPHHRAATPELQNVPGAFYRYRPPSGALAGGYNPTTVSTYAEAMGGSDGYYHTEVSIDATTAIFLPVMGLAEEQRLTPPSATVRIVHVGCDRAIIEIRQSRYGTATVRYGTGSGPLTRTRASDSSGVFHRIVLPSLINGTAYRFDVQVRDQFGRDSVIQDTDDEKRPVAFTFTTLQTCPEVQSIENVKVCRVTADSAEIFWYTPGVPSGSRVVYGPSRPPTLTVEGDVSGRPTEFHYVKIEGLREQTDYWFLVESDGVIDDKAGQYYHFRTPVEYVEFDIRAVRYEWGGLPALGMNIVNHDVKSYDSLDIRLYFRAGDGFENDLAARLDIGIVYDEAGFQQEFSENSAIRNAILGRRPVKLPDTYDPVTGTWAYYLSVPLWGVRMKSGSRIRLDVVFDRRSPWPPYEDLMNQPPQHLITDKDWSFGPHRTTDGDPVNYGGIPSATKADVDENYWSQEVNQYIGVYRKGEYVWGYSPSPQEQRSKISHYELSSRITSPLVNPSEEYVAIDRPVARIDVTGWAAITGDGVINDIWVNGRRVDDLSKAAVYDPVRGRWNLTIPVIVRNGPNVVDITIFGGPEAGCEGCYGCDFANHHFFVEFSGAQQFPSRLVLRSPSGEVLTSDTASIDTTRFVVVVTDKNGDINRTAADSITVLVINPARSDTLPLRLIETGPSTGEFQSGPVSVVSPQTVTTATNVKVDGGDRVVVFYRDLTDSQDTAWAALSTRSALPVPLYGWYLDADGDGAVDRAVVRYSAALTHPPDSLAVWFPDSSSRRVLRVRDSVLLVNGATVTARIAPTFAGGSTGFAVGSAGSGRSYASVSGAVRERTFEMRDSVGPVLLGTALFENNASGSAVFHIRFSEPVDGSKLRDTALVLRRGQSLYPVRVVSIQTREATGTLFSVEVSLPPGVSPRTGDSLAINHAGPLTDWRGNRAHRANRPVPVMEKIGAPSILSAAFFDVNADGIIDLARVRFERPLPVDGLTLVLTWNGTGFRVGSERIRPVPGDSLVIEVDLRGLLADSGAVTTGGTMNMAAAWETFPGDTVRSPVVDSAAPVIIRAVFSPGAGPGVADTLEVEFSEDVNSVAAQSPFLLSQGDPAAPYRLMLGPIAATRGRVHRYLVEEIAGTDYPRDGDSIRIGPGAGIGDTYGNRQGNPLNRAGTLEVKSMPFSIVARAVPNPFTPGPGAHPVPAHIPRSGGRAGVTLIVEASAKVVGAIDIRAKARVYDAVGNGLAQGDFVKGGAAAGRLYWVWDGRNQQGRWVGTGTYLAVISAEDGKGGKTQTARVKIGVVR